MGEVGIAEIASLPISKLDAIGVFIIILVAMVLWFCYKVNINKHKGGND